MTFMANIGGRGKFLLRMFDFAFDCVNVAHIREFILERRKKKTRYKRGTIRCAFTILIMSIEMFCFAFRTEFR